MGFMSVQFPDPRLQFSCHQDALASLPGAVGVGQARADSIEQLPLGCPVLPVMTKPLTTSPRVLAENACDSNCFRSPWIMRFASGEAIAPSSSFALADASRN